MVCPGPGEGLRCCVHPLGGVMCRGHAQYPAFAPGSSKLAVGFWSLCIFCPEFISSAHAPITCSLTQFLCIYCWRRGVSRGRHCSTAAEDPRSQPAGTSRQCEQVSTAAARKSEKKKLKVKNGVERAECSLGKSATLLSKTATFILVQTENIVHKKCHLVFVTSIQFFVLRDCRSLHLVFGIPR